MSEAETTGIGSGSVPSPASAANGGAASGADGLAAGTEPDGAATAPIDGATQTEAVDTATDALDVEELVAALEVVTSERDSHLADLQRISAEYANFRKQSSKRQSDIVEHAASVLAGRLLPILDACESAVSQGAGDVEPIHSALLDVLQTEGLERVADVDEPFDPERHEAVTHEPVDGGGGEPLVTDVMRSGYAWKGRVIRPAMVRVRG